MSREKYNKLQALVAQQKPKLQCRQCGNCCPTNCPNFRNRKCLTYNKRRSPMCLNPPREYFSCHIACQAVIIWLRKQYPNLKVKISDGKNNGGQIVIVGVEY